VNSPRKGRDREREETELRARKAGTRLRPSTRVGVEGEEGGVEAEQWVEGDWVGIEGKKGGVEAEH
jgi:hypothetical protein